MKIKVDHQPSIQPTKEERKAMQDQGTWKVYHKKDGRMVMEQTSCPDEGCPKCPPAC